MSGDQISKPLRKFERRRRRLPHWEGPGETYFITFRLCPGATVDLTAPDLAPLVVEALRYFDRRRYVLYDYTVMPDHVHFILRPLVKEGSSERLSAILHSLKSWLSTQINRRRGRRGRLWQAESYDHILRNRQDYEEKAGYILDNARRRGLVEDPTKWPWWGRGSADR